MPLLKKVAFAKLPLTKWLVINLKYKWFEYQEGKKIFVGGQEKRHPGCL